MSDLPALYAQIQADIAARLTEFRLLWENGGDNSLFTEMCFCTCTPQTNAKHAWDAASRLRDTVECASVVEVAGILRESGVRFHNNKAKSIVSNRDAFFPNTKQTLTTILQSGDIFSARALLVSRVAGWGMKEASHFLRNTGHSEEICILDRHILKQLFLYGVITKIPQTLSPRVYGEIEQQMACFAHTEHIPVDALDLVLWYKAKCELFK
jgi:N-glycosylase/DNA lyase